MKMTQILAALAMTSVAAAALAANKPINANRVTQSKTVSYTCQQGKRVSVKYGFNANGIPVTASAKVNGKVRTMRYDLDHSDNVDTIFQGNGYRLNADACEANSVRKTAMSITSPADVIVFKDCSAR